MIVLPITALWPLSWATIGAPIANHLWQSTLFAGVAGLLTLVLRKNRAQARYWIWLIASVKLLVPFSLLVSLGSHLAWSKAPGLTQPGFSFVMQEISQPFGRPGSGYVAAPAASGVHTVPARVLPTLSLLVWWCGCVAVLFFWWLRWRRLTAAMRRAVPAKSGRELEALRRLERNEGFGQIGLILSESTLEPGIAGILRPVMLLPAGISDRLTDAELEAIITHELCHVRRRDNLVAALHMLVEAVFWFHPLAWWIGARLVDERERACDEEVLRLGSAPHVYAQGILKVCEFYLESPLVCVAGVTGSNLKRRIEGIMMHRIAHKLGLGKKLLLAAMGVTAAIAPVAFGWLHPAQSRADSEQNTAAITPGFESVYIQPNKTGTPMAPFRIFSNPPGIGVAFRFTAEGFAATNATLHMLIRQVYGVQDFQVAGGPDWINSERYDVDTKFTSSEADDRSKLVDQRRLMLQALLANRFKLALHHETRDVPVYELVIAKYGPTLHEAAPGDTYANGLKLPANGHPLGVGLWSLKQGQLTGQGASIAQLASQLSTRLGRMVVDKTGLTGKYDFTMQWTTVESPGAGAASSASLLTAVREQLGLQLNVQLGPVEMLIVDHAEQAKAVGGPLSVLDPASSQAQPQAGAAVSAIFQSVSIKPNGLPATRVVQTRMLQLNGTTELTNVSLKQILQFAYGINEAQISGGPEWLASDLYDINIKTKEPVGDQQFKLQLQKLLADRFKLAVHRELKEMPVYELRVGRDGSKLTEVQPDKAKLSKMTMNDPPGHFAAERTKIKTLAGVLETQTGRPVVDKTGLNGVYDFTLTVRDWKGFQVPESVASLLTALPEQLGLELHPQTNLVAMLIIDHAEQDTGDQ
jgi:bla regulator protein blaR1